MWLRVAVDTACVIISLHQPIYPLCQSIITFILHAPELQKSWHYHHHDRPVEDKEEISLGYDVDEFPWYNTRACLRWNFLSVIRSLPNLLTVLQYVAQSAWLIWIHLMKMAKMRFTLGRRWIYGIWSGSKSNPTWEGEEGGGRGKEDSSSVWNHRGNGNYMQHPWWSRSRWNRE